MSKEEGRAGNIIRYKDERRMAEFQRGLDK